MRTRSPAFTPKRFEADALVERTTYYEEEQFAAHMPTAGPEVALDASYGAEPSGEREF